MAQKRDAELQEDLDSAFANRPPQTVLVLSGGDAKGAFGCGVLAGWRDAPAGRPKFDIVTGVSTGALIATFAFLGEKQDDDVLHDVYTKIKDQDIFKGPLSSGSGSAVLDTAPLKHLIKTHITPAVFQRVAAAHDQGRRLYVATVDLDAGNLVVWPLSRMAADAFHAQGATTATRDLAIKRFRSVLLAAAAIPVLFPPVVIDGDLHVDAGLREGLFLRRTMLGVSAAQDAAKTTEPMPDAAKASEPPTVYAIVNGHLFSNPEGVPDDAFHIGIRSLTLYTDALQLFNLREAAHVAAAHSPPFRFRYISLPDMPKQGSSGVIFGTMFDPVAMTKMYEVGKSMARQPLAGWHEGLPPINPAAEQESPRGLPLASH